MKTDYNLPILNIPDVYKLFTNDFEQLTDTTTQQQGMSYLHHVTPIFFS